MADTGFRLPTATGEDHNEWSSPTKLFASDFDYAFSNTNGARQDLYNYGFTLPPAGLVDGITVLVQAAAFFDSPPQGGSVELSWDGGATYTTTGKSFSYTVSPSRTDFTLGGAADTWGRTWTFSQLTNANFRLRLTAIINGFSDTMYVDDIQVKVFYTEATTTSTSSTSSSTSSTSSSTSTSTSLSTSTSFSTSSTSTSLTETTTSTSSTSTSSTSTSASTSTSNSTSSTLPPDGTFKASIRPVRD